MTSLLLPFLFILITVSAVSSQSIVTSLPGFDGDLPFVLETGYISVGEEDEIQLFYYFTPSENNPGRAPLLLWFSGGPGCSGLGSLLEEIGPIKIDDSFYVYGQTPKLVLNSDSWSKFANILFIDQPVGTGFSYSNTQEGYHSNDTKASWDSYQFLRKWLVAHPDYSKNPFYIGGESYSGIFIPLVATLVADGNSAGSLPIINIHGYILGNAFTNVMVEQFTRIEFSHRTGLISDELYEAAKESCNGNYTVDYSKVNCTLYLQLVYECIGYLFEQNILEPLCGSKSPKPTKRKLDIFDDSVLIPPQSNELWCWSNSLLLSNVWANDISVIEALHVRNGTVDAWSRCNLTVSYTRNVFNLVGYHRYLSTKYFRVLVYSGDHDMAVPYIGTLAWIRQLDLDVADKWRPWFFNGQIAGSTEKYKTRGEYLLTFTTILGAGHTPPSYKPGQCRAMMERWFARYPL